MGTGHTQKVLVSLLALVALVAACSSGEKERSEEPATARSGRTANLFTLSAAGGTFETTAERRYRVTLTGVAGTVVRFTDRPERAAATMRTGTLVDSWHALFGDEPPNAALVVTEGASEEDVVVLTLSRPRYDATADRMEFDGTLLENVSATNRLGFSADDVDPALPQAFGEATLFIDDAPAPPPTVAFYVTFSGESSKGGSKPINNVIAYTAQGEALPTPVLGPSSVTLQELRGMAFDAHQNLYVANANESDSMILAYGPPSADGTRTLLSDRPFAATSSANPGLLHPYGLAFEPGGNLLVSSQDTFVVTRLDPVGAPTDVASGLKAAYPDVPFLAGTVVPGNSPGPQLPPPEPTGLQAPRGVAVAGTTLFVADNAAQKVRAYDVGTGDYIADVLHKDLNDGNPVGLAVAGSVLLVTNEGTDNVVAVDLSDPEQWGSPGSVSEAVRKSTPTGTSAAGGTSGEVTLDAPSGVALGFDGALYVASRQGMQILRFDVSAGTGSVFADNLTDQPEHLITVPSAGATVVR